MRNHDQKARDMARSVLPSKARKRARDERAEIHGRERAHERRLLRAMLRCSDPDDFECDLGFAARHRGDISGMVYDRRTADKLGPLLHWAERLIESDPVLSVATPAERAAHFGKIMPSGLIGDHAIAHLDWVLHGHPRG